MKKSQILFIVKGAVIGALYAVLTIAVSPIAYGPIQFRVSEALTVLPLFTTAAIPGLFIGCVAANAIGVALGMNMAVDIIFGSAATLLAALLTYALRKITVKSFPLLSFMPPVILNSLIVGLELSLFVPEAGAFWYAALTVGVGELVSVFALGVPIYFAACRTKIFSRE